MQNYIILVPRLPDRFNVAREKIRELGDEAIKITKKIMCMQFT